MVTGIPEYNLLRLESQVKIEFALESSDKYTRAKSTSKTVKLNSQCLELSENELLMMEYSFDFHEKFANYEKHRLSQKRNKKNSVLISNKDMNSLKNQGK